MASRSTEDQLTLPVDDIPPPRRPGVIVVDLAGSDSDEPSAVQAVSGAANPSPVQTPNTTPITVVNNTGRSSISTLRPVAADFEHQAHKSGRTLGWPSSPVTELEGLSDAVIGDLPVNGNWPLTDRDLQMVLLRVSRKYPVNFIWTRLENGETKNFLYTRFHAACETFATMQRNEKAQIKSEDIKTELYALQSRFWKYQAGYYHQHGTLHIIDPPAQPVPMTSNSTTTIDKAVTAVSNFSAAGLWAKKFPTELPALFSTRERLTYFHGELTGDNLLRALEEFTPAQICSHLVACGGPDLSHAEIERRRMDAVVDRDGQPVDVHRRYRDLLPADAWQWAQNADNDPKSATRHKTIRASYNLIAAVYVWSACHPPSSLTEQLCRDVLPETVVDDNSRLKAYRTSSYAHKYSTDHQADLQVLSGALESLVDHVSGGVQCAEDAIAKMLQLFDENKMKEPGVKARMEAVKKAGYDLLEPEASLEGYTET